MKQAAPTQQETKTRVVLIRNLPVDVTKKDIEDVAAQFGQVVDVFMLVNVKNIAFIEFETLDEAEAAVERSAEGSIFIRQNKVQFVYSGRKKLEKEDATKAK